MVSSFLGDDDDDTHLDEGEAAKQNVIAAGYFKECCFFFIPRGWFVHDFQLNWLPEEKEAKKLGVYLVVRTLQIANNPVSV